MLSMGPTMRGETALALRSGLGMTINDFFIPNFTI